MKIKKLKHKQLTIITIIFSIISLVFLSTIAYSAFSSTMNITGMAHARIETNVRITNFRLSSAINSTSSYEEFGKSHIISHVDLTSSSSVIYYDLEITNYGNTDIGIYNITGLPSGVNYKIENYNLKDRICDDVGKCNSFMKKTLRLSLTTTSSYEGDIKLDFEFRTVYKITYKNLYGNYQELIMSGESVGMDLSFEIIKYLDVKNANYTYENGFLTLQNVTNNVEVINIKTNYDYDYTGNYQVFTAEYDGNYQLETWGGSGGGLLSGYGGYATGTIKLRKGDTVFIYVAGAGETNNHSNGGSGGYNGGGNGGNAYIGVDTNGYYYEYEGGGGGGGATHIASKQGPLSTLENNIDSIYIVSGGGGGGSDWAKVESNTLAYNGGSGGGKTGVSGIAYDGSILLGATQTSGYSFGLGQDGVTKTTYGASGAEGSGGGGSGFYGGYSYTVEGQGKNCAGSGGSGYIGNNKLKEKYMMCYNCGTSSEENTKTINTECTSEQPTKDCAKVGNGYAKIIMIEYGIKHNITYTGISGNYPTKINDKETLSINLGTNSPDKILVTIDGTLTNNYTYENNVLTITNVTGDINIESVTYKFNYTGSTQTFKVLRSGTYKLETWGAQGGLYGEGIGIEYGTGAYSTGNIYLQKDQMLYIQVGGQGQTCNQNKGGLGGYNGGGSGGDSADYEGSIYLAGTGGGGATHISLLDGLLSSLSNNVESILIVSGGGGGTSCWSNTFSITAAGSGGGASGEPGKEYGAINIISGGTQTSGYAFGQGANGLKKESFSCGAEGSGGGGGGFYGGNTSGIGENSNAGGGGGSGYIGNSLLTSKQMACNKCGTSSEESTKTIEVTCVSETPKENCSKQGNGYAKITLIEVN